MRGATAAATAAKEVITTKKPKEVTAAEGNPSDSFHQITFKKRARAL